MTLSGRRTSHGVKAVMARSARLAAMAGAILLVLTSSACLNERPMQDGSAGHQPIPAATAPPVLRETPMPPDALGLTMLWEQWPARIAARERLVANTDGSTVFDVQYGDVGGLAGLPRSRLQVVDVSTRFGYLGLTTGAQVALIEFERAAESGQPFSGGWDGSTFWVYRPGVGVALIWGASDSPWLYGATAPTVDHMADLMIALHTTITGKRPICANGTPRDCLP